MTIMRLGFSKVGFGVRWLNPTKASWNREGEYTSTRKGDMRRTNPVMGA